MNEYLTEKNSVMNGIQKVYKFPNGYGASVIKHKGSYGYQKGLWELAVLHNGKLCYDIRSAIPFDILDNILKGKTIFLIISFRIIF